jgi:uncharacterized membrane protein YgdD (TMEM256/DUF423 family)
MNAKQMFITAGVLGALAVIIGAFGAHAFPDWLKRQGLEQAEVTRRLENLEVGARYHMYHALALLVLALWQQQFGSRPLGIAGGLMLLGVILFSGCLYAYAVSGIKLFAMIVPLGGLSFIAGWATLVVAWRGN